MSDKKIKPLKPQQKLFCQLYATDREFYGNGVESYIESYDLDLTKKGAYNGARASASKLLTKPNILEEINRLLEEGGLNDTFVDKQLKFLVTQNAELHTKLGAIAEYNKLKARIIKKIDHTSGGKEIKGFNYLTPENGINNSDNKTNS